MDARDAARIAGRVGGMALKAKIIGVASVVFVAFLLVVGMFGAGIGGKAIADSCGDRGLPEVDTGAPGPGGAGPPAKLREEQIANARIIDGVAAKRGLSGRATLVALVTALQESTLINRRDGHLDSVGLFQQRPSAGWGTVEQIMDPEYSSAMFFFGDDDGSPRGLTDVSGWAVMDLGAAAQAVQVSAHPELYAGHESRARQLADEAGIDLGRAGSVTGDEGTGTPDDGANGDQDDGPSNAEECYPGSTVGTPGSKPGQPGEPFHDGEADWPASVKNPRSTADAIAWARQEAETGGRDWWRLCLAFVARTYGWSFSGVPYAIDHYRQMPANMRNDRDRNPPPGALMYWDTGQRAGHVSIYLGNGEIASNDIRRPGYIDVVPATDVESKWGATYLGWAPPYFPKGG